MKGFIKRRTTSGQVRQTDDLNTLKYENVTKETTFEMYSNCVRVSSNYVGGPSALCPSTPAQLITYADRIMSLIPEDKRNKLKRTAVKYIKKIDTKLKITLIEAQDLVAKDPNGVSDPYCLLWVRENEVQRSKTKRRTLHPQWNESFLLNVSSNEDMLTLQIWDEDPRSLTSTLGQVKDLRSLKGFYRYVKDVTEVAVPGGNYVDDLIGSTTIAVKHIPFVNADLWLPLKMDETNIKGGIHLMANFQVVPPKNHNVHRTLQEHMTICMYCLRDRLLNSQDSKTWYTLVDAFTPAGMTLLKQHALQSSLTPFQHATCVWLCSSYLHMKEETSYTYLLLFEILEDVRSSINVQENSLAHRSLLSNLRLFNNYCYSQLSHLHSSFPLNDRYACIQLQSFLCLILLLATFLPNVRNRMKEAIKIDAANWHHRTFTNMGLTTLNENTAENLKDVLRAYYQNQEIANGIFLKVWKESYTEYVCLNLDDVMKTGVKPLIEMMVQKANTDDDIQTLLHVFYTVKVLVDYTVESMAHVNDRPNLEMERYTDWFGQNTMRQWFTWAVKSCLPWIQKSVELEEMEPISYDVKCGVSSKDLLDILQTRLLHLWQNIDWPDVTSTILLSQSVRDCVIYYANEIADKIEENGYYDIEGEFEISTKLCVALNSLSAVIDCLKFVKEEIKANLHSRKEIENMNSIMAPLEEATKSVEDVMEATCLEIVSKVNCYLRARDVGLHF